MRYMVEVNAGMERANAVDAEGGPVPCLPRSWSDSGPRPFTAMHRGGSIHGCEFRNAGAMAELM